VLAHEHQELIKPQECGMKCCRAVTAVISAFFRAALLLSPILLISVCLLSSCYTINEIKARAAKERQENAGNNTSTTIPLPKHSVNEKDIHHGLNAPPSTDPSSEKKWTKHSVQLPQGFRVQNAQASGREVSVLGYDDGGKIFVGEINRGLAFKPYIVSAPAPKELAALDAVVLGGRAYVLFHGGEYYPDREPWVASLYYRGTRYHPRDGYSPPTPTSVRTWDEKAGEWVAVEGLPKLIDRMYGNGGKDVILLCYDEGMHSMTFFAYRPGAGVRKLYSATEALVNVTSPPEDVQPKGAFSFYGDEAFYTVTVWPGSSDGFVEQEWPRWLGVITPDGGWVTNTQLSTYWAFDERETPVLSLPQHKYVFIDGGLCEYSEALELVRRLRLPDNLRSYAIQQPLKALPIYGGLLTFEPRSRRVTILLNPELGRD
jgi:hypothetical protein